MEVENRNRIGARNGNCGEWVQDKLGHIGHNDDDGYEDDDSEDDY